MQHPTAIVSSTAKIADDVKIGPYSVIEDDVVIGRGTIVYSSVSIKDGARIGENVKIYHAAAVAGPPQDLKFAGEKTELFVGDNTIVREFVTLNRGTAAHGKTEIGKNCLFMAYSHAAHDCIIGDNVIIANSVQMGGHVEIGDYAIIGGATVIHQFCLVGEHCMVGGGFRITQDILPYSSVAGYPLRCLGLNSIGLQRRGFSPETIATLKKLFRLLMSKKLNTSQALAKIDVEVEKIPEVANVLEFIKRSGRGIVK
ncbi:MAG: acyl-ACP--UDP-N-acetylglucosamine O-acyltransferase [Candidatus Zixiibacteriota bacterium]|nr:MAG: acyl-ACP--UDP-N-acetylglucosamine O-acyltransferase [candidate division Zixibacteria bacterium]